ncbi:hypothetical protein IWW36_001646 [Coemansia brasiliensis]|uniref:Uncharacterized protein n=1 Tax=Coemansia brasiliensis TaxID=2650707 RepID=A0A9W8LYW0_9FUNG|nr:hypothetical protein IWW36_001646 [Coemansia brasiliensis]
MPASHSTYFKLCEPILKQRGGQSEGNVMLRMELKKLNELSISLEKEANYELKDTGKEYMGYREKHLNKKRTLEGNQVKLDQAAVIIIEGNSAVVNDPVEHVDIMRKLLAQLVKAKAQNLIAKSMFGSIKSNYAISEARYNSANAHHNVEQKIAKVKDEIDVNIAFERYSISPK